MYAVSVLTTDVRRLAVGLFALDTRLEKLDAKVEKLDAKIEKLNTEVDKLGRAFEGPEGGKVDETDLKNVLRSSMAQIRKENEEHRVRTDDRYLDFIRSLLEGGYWEPTPRFLER